MGMLANVFLFWLLFMTKFAEIGPHPYYGSEWGAAFSNY